MGRIVVVGSGAAGVNFAASILKKGRRVLMLDVGHKAAAHVNEHDDFNGLKRNLPDPATYFLGPKYESAILPGYNSEYYGFPPNKSYVFARPPIFDYQTKGLSPLVSFAQGGLAETWTGGSYPFRDEDLIGFPFSYREIHPYYGQVAGRIGITGTEDDLARFFPLHDGLLEPLDLDEHSSLLLRQYAKNKQYLNEKLGCYVGRSRTAVLSRDLNGRKRCDYSGRCLWGCPSGSLYTPSLTLAECLKDPNFEYASNMYVTHFLTGLNDRITKVAAVSVDNGQTHEIDADVLVLAAGTLCSSSIFLQSVFRSTGEIPTLPGLMDNRQILMPFVNLGMLGKRYDPNTYQYHQIAIGMEGTGAGYIHGLVTTLKTALIHPVVQSIPFDLGTGLSLFRNMHAALGLININFPDHPRADNSLTLDMKDPRRPRLLIQYTPDREEAGRLKTTSSLFRKVLWKLGCIAPPSMTHIRPMGASVHYAGTVPMSESGGAMSCSKLCQSRAFPNLYFVDGTTFPSLPAKNLTFTLMANAVRVAEEAF